ncbi:MAG: DNA-binding NarL/FixJ family response regulator, partial [Gammaproteobacteria bacterium]
MRILLIDNEDLVLEFWRTCLEDGLPGVEISEYQSEKLGRPAADFDWSVYDLLLLDYDLGRGENGIEWLQAFSSQSGFPITVLITAVTEPDVVARALRCGADGYLNKTEMTPARLVATVIDVTQGPLVEPQTPVPVTSAVRPPQPGTETSLALDEIAGGANYRFGRCIGKGAMSMVYLAERSTDGQTVVIKVLDRRLASDEEFVARFRLEGPLVADLNSPYVV